MSRNNPQPPRAFMGSNESLCYTAINRMAHHQRQMALRHLTIEDLRQAYVPIELRDALRSSFEASYYGGYNQTMEVAIRDTEGYPDEYSIPVEGNPLKATFSWTRDACPEGFLAMGREPMLQPDVTPELRERLDYAFSGLMRASYEFGLVAYVFRELNVNGFCNTPHQMRYVWPAIRHIVAYTAGTSNTRDLANSLIEASSRAGDKARVPPHIAAHLVPTSNIVNRMLLVDQSEPVKLNFEVKLNTPAFPIANADRVFAGMN